MIAEILYRHACDACGKLHTDHSDAVSCCPNTSTERFVCSVCNEAFWDSREAMTHLLEPHGHSAMTPDEIAKELLLFTDLPYHERVKIAADERTAEEKYLDELRFGATV